MRTKWNGLVDVCCDCMDNIKEETSCTLCGVFKLKERALKNKKLKDKRNLKK